MDPLALGAAFAVLVATVVGIVALGAAATNTASKTARQRLQNLFGTSVLDLPVAGAGSALREKGSSEFLGLGQLSLGREWAAKASLNLDQADLHLRVGEYVTLRIGMGLLFFGMAFVLIPSRPAAMVIGIALGIVGFLMPAFFVRHRKKSRLNKLESQLEEVLTMTANSLKAGFGLLQSLELAAQQLDHPIATELRRTLHDINIGSSTEDALLALSERASSYDLDIVITAILIQRSVGGNLAEILDTVAHTMRERARIRGHIKAVTSQQRLTGYILGGLPMAVMGLLFLVSSDYMSPLFSTLAGQVLLIGAGIMEFIGVLLIRRILSIEV
jgi:tight adherence protein B